MDSISYMCSLVDLFISEIVYHVNTQKIDHLRIAIFQLLQSGIKNPDDIYQVGSSRTGTTVRYYPVIDFLTPMNCRIESTPPDAVKRQLQKELAQKGYDSEQSRIGIVFPIGEIYVGVIPFWLSAERIRGHSVAFCDDSTPRLINCDVHDRKINAMSPFFRSCVCLMKAWNASNGNLLESFHIESMLLRMNIAEVNWTVTLLDLFSKMSEMLATPMVADESNEVIDRYLSPQVRKLAIELCDSARDISQKVLLLAYSDIGVDAVRSAIHGYSRLFGDIFVELCNREFPPT